jgi:hypothetical protein
MSHFRTIVILVFHSVSLVRVLVLVFTCSSIVYIVDHIDTSDDSETIQQKYQTRKSITRIMHYATYYTLPEKNPINQPTQDRKK